MHLERLASGLNLEPGFSTAKYDDDLEQGTGTKEQINEDLDENGDDSDNDSDGENPHSDEEDHDQEEIIRQQQRQLEIREKILARRANAALNDKKLTKASYIMNSDIYTTDEKLEALADLELSDADYDNCKEVVLKRERGERLQRGETLTVNRPPRPAPVRSKPSSPRTRRAVPPGPPPGALATRKNSSNNSFRQSSPPGRPISPRAKPSSIRTRNVIQQKEEDVIGASSSDSDHAGGNSDDETGW